MPRPSYEQVRFLLRRRVRLITTRDAPTRFARFHAAAAAGVRWVVRRFLVLLRPFARWSMLRYGSL